MGYPEDDAEIVFGSALMALKDEKPELGVEAIKNLLDKVDEAIPQPERPLDLPFLMPVEDVFSIGGRGTVVTGKIERGTIKIGEEISIVGLAESTKTTCTGIEMFHKLLDDAQAGENVGLL